MRDYAIELIAYHAKDIEWLTIFECHDEWVDGENEITDEEAARVDELIRGAKITVTLEDA